VHLVYFQNADDRETFLRLGIVMPDRVRMIAGSGVDTARFVPQEGARDDQMVRFVMIARALREKGVLEYIAAARIVRSRCPEASFTLIGGTDNRNPSSLTDDEVHSICLEAGVRWVGHVDDVREFLADADIVVLPSYREGTPMSLLEAASMARPMIATNVPGCTEVVRDGFNGWLVRPRDSDALASTMLTALAQRDRWVEYGRNARDLATARFDSRVVCQQMIGDYRDLIRRNTA
jgi:glycosyltransferase involved in cell wall biosynthesis